MGHTICDSVFIFIALHGMFKLSASAIILIVKHAASLSLSGLSIKVALTQVEADYWEANITSRIEEQFPASYKEYTNEQFIDFLTNTKIG